METYWRAKWTEAIDVTAMGQRPPVYVSGHRRAGPLRSSPEEAKQDLPVSHTIDCTIEVVEIERPSRLAQAK